MRYLKNILFFCNVKEKEKEKDKDNININSDFKSYPNQILFDSLFLGTWQHAKDGSIINDLKITHIVNVTPHKNYFENNGDCESNEKEKEKEKEKEIQYYRINVDDDAKAADTLKQHFNKVIEFIDNALKNNNNKVLIHCEVGISRSSTVTIAYIMKRKNMKFVDAFEFVKTKRPRIKPRKEFQTKLKEFEMELFAKK